jgi:hypothetical protein
MREGDNLRNVLPLPKPLHESIEVNEEFLKKFNKEQTFNLFRVKESFRAEERRHITIDKG